MERPNIVFITIESARADHTSFITDRNTTPELERIAATEKGDWSGSCFANSMKTPPSTASILTGTYPSTHGVGIGRDGPGHLSTDIRTLPEMLSAAGYQTQCISTNAYASTATGLDRGFDDFSWLQMSENNFLPTSEHFLSFLKYALRIRTYGPGFTRDGQRHNVTYILIEKLKRWISDAVDRTDPFFCYAHVQNPHHPYTPPKKFAAPFFRDIDAGVEEAIRLSLDVFSSNANKKRLIAEGLPLSADELDLLERLYDAEIAYADDRIGSLFRFLRSLDEPTILFVTGDHGELFGEYGLIGHNLVLHDALINVPLVTYNLSSVDLEQHELVQHVDLTRTIAEIAGCDDEQFEGIDLRTQSREYVVSQRGFDNLEAYTRHNSEFDTSRFQQQCLNCVRTESFKYLRGDEGADLYALPDEERNCLDSFVTVAKRLESVLDRTGDCCASAQSSSQDADFTEDMIDQLHDLGYL